MNILGCLDLPTDGDYILDGENVSRMNDSQLAKVRNKKWVRLSKLQLASPGFSFGECRVTPKLFGGCSWSAGKSSSSFDQRWVIGSYEPQANRAVGRSTTAGSHRQSSG